MSDTLDQSEQPPGLIFGIESPITGESAVVSLPLAVAANIHEVIRTQGIEAVHNLVWLGANAIKGGLSEEEFHRLRRMVETIETTIKQWKDREDLLLGHSYAMLRNKQWKHKQAAQFASSILGTRINTNAWRMRVERWAKSQGLPKVEQRKREVHES